jgi:hypothetical protein
MKAKVTSKHRLRELKSYRRARTRALARLRDGMDLRWTPARSRDEIHERRADQ